MGLRRSLLIFRSISTFSRSKVTKRWKLHFALYIRHKDRFWDGCFINRYWYVRDNIWLRSRSHRSRSRSHRSRLKYGYIAKTCNVHVLSCIWLLYGRYSIQTFRPCEVMIFIVKVTRSRSQSSRSRYEYIAWLSNVPLQPCVWYGKKGIYIHIQRKPYGFMKAKGKCCGHKVRTKVKYGQDEYWRMRGNYASLPRAL